MLAGRARLRLAPRSDRGRHGDRSYQPATPYTELAKRTGLTRRTVIRAAHTLVDLGALKVNNPHKRVNGYALEIDPADVLVLNDSGINTPRTFLKIMVEDVRAHGALQAVVLSQVRLGTSNPKQHNGLTWFNPRTLERHARTFISRASQFRALKELVDEGVLVQNIIDGLRHYRIADLLAATNPSLTAHHLFANESQSAPPQSQIVTAI